MKLSALGLIAALLVAAFSPASASAQIAPRIAIAFDTSGSMALDLDGIPTFGDGVLTNCTAGGSGEMCGTNCTAGIDTNCDGLPNDSRMSIAKQAVSNTVLAFGDVDWMLARFPQTQGSGISCLEVNDFECNALGPYVTSYGNPQCNTGTAIPTGACPFDWPSLWPGACRPGSGGRPALRRHSGGSPSVCTNYGGQCSIGASGGDVLVGFPDRGAYSGMDNSYGILSWLDNAESNFVNSRTTANFCNVASGVGDCELRPEGPTPLAGLLTSVGNYISPIRAADSASACRPYSVILLTDGAETCLGDPEAAAAALRSAGILTYVVGFAVSGAARTQLNDIAIAGGTDAGATGGDRAFFADDLVTLSAGLSSIVRDSLLSEVCNLLDDDCDTRIDEGVQNACGTCGPVPSETCNTVDDDCDGSTDEGVANACGDCAPPPTEICNRSDDDCDGIIDEDGMGGDICAGCSPTAEICDGRDNDCDMTIDEDVTRACGTDVGECTGGTETCVVGGSGTWGSCAGSVGPSTEVCDNLDNDCDGTIDGFSRPCGDSTGECLPGNEVCVAGTFGMCIGAVGMTPELCDGEDDDCDGMTDEGDPGGGGACGTALGICTAGTLECMGGMLVCRGGTGPDPMETCNSLDDDCDGVTDEGNPGGGGTCGMSDVGACELGVLTCSMGSVVCVGETGPSPEVCDGLDNDCDTRIDEGDPEGGGACGDDTGECTSGTFACVSGTLTCMGGTGPTMELCDGLDNDCDGVIDDGIPVGAPCGSDVGECVPGRNVCRAGGLVCEGGIPAEMEACDDLDNDCDGTIDEGLGLGGPCGSSEGLCMPGMERCIAGRLICEGEVGPGREACDCEDNDCDGMTDEPPDTGALCPPGSSCVDCQCALPCMMSEFGFVCPTGRAPVETGGECFCVAERCDDTTCGAETVERMGETLCGPGSTDVANCVCRSNECTFACDGVVCMGGTVCDPRDPLGRCVENNCRGLGCGGGEICNIDTGVCDADPCTTVTCGAMEACRDGVCEAICAGVDCAAGEVCRAGTCEGDLCADSSCPGGEICAPATGDCVEDLCLAIRCPAAQVCEASTGNCVADPCNALNCPAMTVCEEGECVEDLTGVDAGVDAGGFDAGTGDDPHDRVLAAGGCSCRVGAPTEARNRGGMPWALALGVFGFVTWRRRRRLGAGGKEVRRQRGAALPFALALVVAVTVSLTSGCDVEPFCLDCDDGMADGGDAGVDAGGVDAGPRDAGADGGYDGGVDACVEEACNGLDDDCDGMTDEDFDLQNNTEHCGACNDLCAPTGAFPSCSAGVCEVDSCDVGRFDLDGDPANGCEYRCLVETPDDAACDLRDNDCDGVVDEDVDTDTDVDNCGACGVVCTFAHGAASCVSGACVLGDCEPDFIDVDGNPANGCEYACTVATPATETCNLADDDCDGMIDEGDPGGGGACGIAVGDCTGGVEACIGGTIACMGAVLPATETCNGSDEDCDGMTDEGNPGGGTACGTDLGVCSTGRMQCTGGALDCVGAVDPSMAESCNSLDDDCDGSIDEGNPGGGSACGVTTGECSGGMEMCLGGALQCQGATGPTIEVCDTLDNDCDGMTDENFDLANDRNNCGGCGTVCAYTDGVAGCSASTCSLLGCLDGFFNADMDDTNGCEYACSFAGTEICNGADDDCDGTTDMGLTPPTSFCNPNGVCAGTTPVCTGAMGWVCTYGGAYEPSEVSCDMMDNDCNGIVDDPFPTVGNTCGNGAGACRTTGTIECTSDASGTLCNAAPPLAGLPDELCNNLDDDCDGMTDEDIPLSAIPTVNIGGVRVMQYEASRPDAAAGDPGAVEDRACSAPNVLPWTNVTWPEARDACCALNASGSCTGGSGWRLCDSNDWENACQASSGSCEWSYLASCSSSSPLTCNGEEFDSSGASGDQDAVYPTGSSTFGSCRASWGGAGAIYDLSGNVKEWTNTSPTGGVHEIRGGAYNNVEPGRTCTFDFTVGDNAFAFPNTGFRCCFY